MHEFGHFIAARLSGVRVTDFSIGFGPLLFKKKVKETNFLICWIPLGGYIIMAGDSSSESRGYKDEFYPKPAGIRARIVFAGPLFNYLLAFILFVTIATFGYRVKDTVVGAVLGGSPAEAAGIASGDRIVSVDGRKTESWKQLQDRVYGAKDSVEVILIRNQEKIELEVGLEKKKVKTDFGREIKASQMGISPYGTTVGEVVDGYPAKEAGIESGDKILAVDGQEVKTWGDIFEKKQETEKSVSLKIKRNENVFSLEVPVKREKSRDLGSDLEYVSTVGIRPISREKLIKVPFPSSVLRGSQMLFEMTFLSLRGLWYMATDRSISLRESLAGPIYIMHMTPKIAEAGLDAYLQFIALLSVFLTIINLFPIPVFDGGHILFFGIEKIRSRRLSHKTEDIATRIGLILIITLMFFVVYNDILRVWF